MYALLVPFYVLILREQISRGGSDSAQTQGQLDSKFVGKTSDDAYQVSKSEYDDNFVSRYGLLVFQSQSRSLYRQNFNRGCRRERRICICDESWKEGRKSTARCSKWFSNGIKMYERNYQEGRWHGSVTRWWPNGQKMYVRAYSNGVRHGNEATWRSDGTSLSLPVDGKINDVELETENNLSPVVEEMPTGGDLEDSLPAQPDSDQAELILPGENEEPMVGDEAILPGFPEISDEQPPALPGLDESGDSTKEELPVLPGVPERVDTVEFPALPGSDDSSNFPALPGLEEPDDPSNEELPGLPVPAEEEDAMELPALPGSDDSDNFPALPGLEEPDDPSNDELPSLLGLPEGGDSGGGAVLPGMEDEEDGLPPLPSGDDGGFGDLPPLPPLP